MRLVHWEFRRLEGPPYYRPHHPENPWRPARAPGGVHLDLIENGVIADPFERQFEAGVQWVDEVDWEYRTHFDADLDNESPYRRLRFDGLDSICEVFLNGEKIAEHDNMHLPLTVDVAGKVKSVANELRVIFRSNVRVGDERRTAYFNTHGIPLDTTHFDERAFVRKALYQSGWDWGPRLVGSGLWKPAFYEEFANEVRDVEIQTTKQGNGTWRIQATAKALHGEPEFFFGGEVYEGELDVVIEDPILWSPEEPHLYPLRVSAESARWQNFGIGLREIRLIRESDAMGESFEFEINGRRTYMVGANWIPADALPGRISRDDVREQVATAAMLGFNMFRVWGGGFYESDEFYEACDRHGILVWQDFPYACSYFPDDEASLTTAKKEAEFHVKRLRHHPSLALWCGGNENETMWEGHWDGPGTTASQFHGEKIYTEALASVVSELDPETPYIRSSPLGSTQAKVGEGTGDQTHGNMHVWSVWHGDPDYHAYAKVSPRFCSEFGYASACHLPTWREALGRVDLTARDGDVLWHDKTHKGYKFYEFVEARYPRCETLEDWVYYSQLMQRDALQFAIEHFRSCGTCRGALIWQFNDCWPVSSWSVRDFGGRLKIAAFELQRVFRSDLIAMTVAKGTVELTAINDSDEPYDDELTIWIYQTDGSLLRKEERSIHVPLGITKLEPIKTDRLDSTKTVVRVLSHNSMRETWRTLAEPNRMNFAPPKLERAAKGVKVTGLAVDLVFWDAETLEPIPWAWPGADGWYALCVHDETLSLPEAPRRLAWRCLGGRGVV